MLHHPRNGTRGAKPVVDADHGDAAGARRVHRQQRSDAFERRAVSDTGGHCHDGSRTESADHACEGALHACNNHDCFGRRDLIEVGEQSV